LHILGERIVDLHITSTYLVLDVLEAEQRLAAHQNVHALDERREVSLDDEVLTLIHEGLNRPRDASRHAPYNLAPALTGEIGVLLGAGKRELLRNDLLG